MTDPVSHHLTSQRQRDKKRTHTIIWSLSIVSFGANVGMLWSVHARPISIVFGTAAIFTALYIVLMYGIYLDNFKEKK